METVVPLTGETFNPRALGTQLPGAAVDSFRASTQIETANPDVDRLDKGVLVGVGGRQPAGVAYAW